MISFGLCGGCFSSSSSRCAGWQGHPQREQQTQHGHDCSERSRSLGCIAVTSVRTALRTVALSACSIPSAASRGAICCQLTAEPLSHTSLRTPLSLAMRHFVAGVASVLLLLVVALAWLPATPTHAALMGVDFGSEFIKVRSTEHSRHGGTEAITHWTFVHEAHARSCLLLCVWFDCALCLACCCSLLALRLRVWVLAFPSTS